MNVAPSFSIVIPSYNRGSFIHTTIESVLAQTYSIIEVIIIDDGSTDDTEQLVKAFVDSRITYYRQENAERASARNTGVRLAKSEYVTFLDSDDLLYPDHIAEACHLIEKLGKPDFFHLAYEVKDSEGKVLSQNQYQGDLNKQLIKGNFLSCMGVFVKREVMMANPFNEDRLLSGSEDWELWMRLASRYPLYYSNTITSAIIQHEGRSVVNTDEEKLTNRIILAVSYLEKDTIWQQHYGTQKPTMMAHLWLYISLHLIMAGNKRRGLHYWYKAIASALPVIFSRKSVVILWKLIQGA